MVESPPPWLNAGRPLAVIGRWVLSIALLGLAVWAELAIWFQAPLPTAARIVVAGIFAAAFLAAAFSLISGKALKWTSPAAAALGLLLVFWWGSITPRQDRAWLPDVARTSVIEIKGDDVEVRNVRTFNWTGAESAEQRWESRLYSLSDLRGLDVFTSHWGSDAIAHVIASFSFAQGPPLAISLEIRREQGEEYSPIAGFFKAYELALIAADESDIVKVRSNRRNEVVYRFPIDARTENIAKLLTKYAALSQELAAKPRFYHTIWTNCTTQVHAMLRAIDPAGFPFDYRLLLSGKVPEYLYSLDFIDNSQPFAEVRRRADITLKAKLAETDRDFSAAIRR